MHVYTELPVYHVEYWETALKTGRTIPIQQDGNEYLFGVILDPQALIKALQSKYENSPTD